MRPLALIIARAGSKGLPGKNEALVADRECARWTIDAALASHHVARTALSTDSRPLLTIAIESGIDAIARPPELATDTATVDAAARHAINSLADTTIDTIVILYANVPVRPSNLIGRALETLERTGADSVQSYAPVGKHHPWWTARLDPATAKITPWTGKALNNNTHRRQDLPPAHIPDGGVLAVRRNALMIENPSSPHAFLGKDHRGILTKEGDVIDIDSRIDLLVADAILRERAEQHECAT